MIVMGRKLPAQSWYLERNEISQYFELICISHDFFSFHTKRLAKRVKNCPSRDSNLGHWYGTPTFHWMSDGRYPAGHPFLKLKCVIFRANFITCKITYIYHFTDAMFNFHTTFFTDLWLMMIFHLVLRLQLCQHFIACGCPAGYRAVVQLVERWGVIPMNCVQVPGWTFF